MDLGCQFNFNWKPFLSKEIYYFINWQWWSINFQNNSYWHPKIYKVLPLNFIPWFNHSQTRLKTLHYYRVVGCFLTKPEGETIPVSLQVGWHFYLPEVKTDQSPPLACNKECNLFSKLTVRNFSVKMMHDKNWNWIEC